MNIRPMEFGDIRQVHQIECDSFDTPWSKRIFEDCLLVGYEAWVICNPEIRAYGLMSMNVGEAHILNLCVSAADQRQGLGHKLMTHFIELAKIAFIHEIILEVRIDNIAAQHLYTRLGFELIGFRKNYYVVKDGTKRDANVLKLEV